MDVQIAEPVGKWDGEKQYLMTPEDSAYIKKLQADSPRLANGQIMINRDIFSGVADHCPAVSEFMELTVDGQLMPCNFLQFSLGTIGEHTVEEMRSSLMGLKWFNGTHPCCLCGEDQEFIEKYIMPYTSCRKPLDANKIFLSMESQ